MAKKKNKHKRHTSSRKPQGSPKSKSSSAPQPVAASASATVPDAAATKSANPAKVDPRPVASGTASRGSQAAADETARWAYVGRDVRRVGTLISACIAVELLLWYVLNYTPFGTQLYEFIKV